MNLTDRPGVVAAIRPDAIGLRLRFGTVISIQNDRTCTVTIAGGTTNVVGVRYAAHVAPVPAAACVLASDGSDLFIIGVLAAADRTPSPRVYRDADLSVVDGTDTAVTWAAVNSDAWTSWSSGAATRLTARLRGRYMATAWVQFAGNGTGIRSAWIRKDGATTFGRVQVAPSSAGLPTQFTVASPVFDLEVGQYVELLVRQTSGGALLLTRDGAVSPSLSLIYLGP